MVLIGGHWEVHYFSETYGGLDIEVDYTYRPRTWLEDSKKELYSNSGTHSALLQKVRLGHIL